MARLSVGEGEGRGVRGGTSVEDTVFEGGGGVVVGGGKEEGRRRGGRE